MMNNSERWHKLRELGEGGQGKVHLVLDRNEWVPLHELLASFSKRTSRINSEDERDTPLLLYELRNAFWEIADEEKPPREYALKELHQGRQNRNEEQARERIRREIKTMREVSHPNLIQIVDASPEHYWFVSKYYNKGTLSNIFEEYSGRLLKIMDAFIPLVEGVAYLHKKGIVHRDIKPDNIFVNNDGSLVLGDFGIVYFTDPQMTRLSNTI